MHIDKFGRNCERTTTIYAGLDIANLGNTFLRRDGGNIALGAIDMNNNISNIFVDPLTYPYQDVATKNYVDRNAAVGGVVFCDIKLSIGFDLERSLGCDDLSAGKNLHFC